MGLKIEITEEQFLDDEAEMLADLDEQDEMEYFMREEAERDDRERMWAEEAHKQMHEGENDE